MFKRFWKAIDGKKTFTGLLLTAAGVVMMNFPFTAPAAPYLLTTGLAALGVGAGHKVQKYVEEKKSQKEEINNGKAK